MYRLRYHNGVVFGVNPEGKKCCITDCGEEWRYLNRVKCEQSSDGKHIMKVQFDDADDDIFDIDEHGIVKSQSTDITYKLGELSQMSYPSVLPMIDTVVLEKIVPDRVYILCGIQVISPQNTIALMCSSEAPTVYALIYDFDRRIKLKPCIGAEPYVSGGCYSGPFINVGMIIKENNDFLVLECSAFSTPLIWRDKKKYWSNFIHVQAMKPFGLIARTEEGKYVHYYALTETHLICKSNLPPIPYPNIALSGEFPDVIWNAKNVEYKKITDRDFNLTDPDEYTTHAVYESEGGNLRVVIWRQEEVLGTPTARISILDNAD